MLSRRDPVRRLIPRPLWYHYPVTYPYERRRYRRVTLNLPAMVEIADGQREAHSYPALILDISEGGMQLETRAPVAVVGEEVIIHVTITDRLDVHAKIRQADKIEVELSDDEDSEESVVRWSDGDSGKFGVEFVNLEGSVRDKLKKLVERALAANGDITKI